MVPEGIICGLELMEKNDNEYKPDKFAFKGVRLKDYLQGKTSNLGFKIKF